MTHPRGHACPHDRLPETGTRPRTRCMPSHQRSDVVLVPFDFTERSGVKWRPAVVVSTDDYNRTTPDVLIVSITSNLRALPHPGDVQIADWRSAGRLKPSLAQTKLATIESALVGRRLGALSAPDLARVDHGLAQALGLMYRPSAYLLSPRRLP